MYRKMLVTALTVLLAGTAAQAARPQYSLVGAWDFEDGYSDVSGFEPLYTGVEYLTGMSIVHDAERNSNVVNFSSAGNGVVYFGPTDGTPGKLAMRDVVSLAFWVKPDTEDWWMGCVGKGAGAAYRVFRHGPGWLFMAQYGFSGGSEWPQGDYGDPPTVPSPPGTWVHVGVNYDGNWGRMYLNGQLVSELEVEDFEVQAGENRDLWHESTPFMIGNISASWSTPFQGSLDDVAIWRGVVSGEDFAELYAGTKTAQEVEPDGRYLIAPADESLMGWWHFEEGAGGTTTADLAPNPAADAQILGGGEILWDDDQGFVVGHPTDPNSVYVNCGTDAKFEAFDGFTLTAWIKPEASAASAWSWVMGKGSSGYRLFYHGEGFIFIVNAGDTLPADSMLEGAWGAMPPGEWYHIAAVYKPNHPAGYDPNDDTTWGTWGMGELRFYIDGVAHYPSWGNGALKGPRWDSSADPFTLKMADPSPFINFPGQIDDVRIYNYPMNHLEVRWAMGPACISSMVEGDLTGDCVINMDDLGVLAASWITAYDLADFGIISNQWLEGPIYWPYSTY